MEIAIVGISGIGKSNLGDIIRNTIFKLDSNSCIRTNDPDRTKVTLGSGSNMYNVNIVKVGEEQSVIDVIKKTNQDNDITIVINNKKFLEWFRKTYNQ